MESILTSVKKMLGITEDYEHFDQDIIMHINSVFMILWQLGVGPSECFSIRDNTAIWSDFMGDNTKIEAVKTYIYLRVGLLFDPPLSSSVLEAKNNQIKELEWRLHIIADSPTNEEIQNGGDG